MGPLSQAAPTIDLIGGKCPELFYGSPTEIVRAMNETAFVTAGCD